MRRRMFMVSAILLVPMFGCSGDSSALETLTVERDDLAEQLSSVGDQLDSLQTERDEVADSLLRAEEEASEASDEVRELEDQLAEIDSRREELEGQLDATSTRADELQAELEAEQAALEGEQAAREAAEEELEAIRLRFDPEIQQAVAAAQAAITDAACVAAEANGFDPSANPTPNIDLLIDQEMVGLPEGTAVDRDAISSRVAECRAQGEARAAQAALTSPKGDGFWTVGVEIAAGRWRSSGTGDSCYWKRTPDGAPDDIIDNHFGNAGGTVTIRDGEEFETDDCGTWEYLD